AADANIVTAIEEMARGRVDAIALTNLGQIRRLIDTAKQHGWEDRLREGLAQTPIASVGPAVSDELKSHGLAAAIYPAVQRITGPDFFRAMARSHVRSSPPSSPLLFEYGRDFPSFIATYEYARQLPWLADVARIERAWLDAYHAADAAPLVPAQLAAVDAERLGELVFGPHPATRLVRSDYAAATIFAANRTDAAVPRIDASTAENALITRPDVEVVVRHLPPGGA
ncbi:hypothetical protein KXV85_001690, partial [Aspergillus fumigatus]